MLNRKPMGLIIFCILITTAICGCLDDDGNDEFEVAVLHYGPIGDYGWTYEAHKGAQEMAQSLSYIKLEERENSSASDVSQLMREYADNGYEVIFCHSWDFGDAIEEVAPDYPDTTFMWGSGNEKKASNAGIYYGRMYEARFLSGMAAA